MSNQLLSPARESAVRPRSAASGYHFEQDLPGKLCADRELKTTEIHPSNDFYGQASVLKRYAGLPEWYSLKAVLEHAPVVQDDMWDDDRHALLPVNLSCTASRARHLKAVSGKPSVPIGFGFLYAARLVDGMFGLSPPSERRAGTVVFPFKSTHHIQTHFDHADYAQRLADLPSWMQPTTICVYWKDYLRGVHRDYERFGHQIVTAGHMFDSDFLLRLYDICRRFRYAASNEFGTHVLLSVASGCSFSYVSSGAITRNVPRHLRENYVRDMPGFNLVREASRQVFGGLNRQISPAQQQFADHVLGTQYVKSPRQLRGLLLRAEVRDKFRPLSRSKDHPLVQLLPACSRRFFQRLGGLPRRLRDAIRRTAEDCAVSGQN